ncbi:hypothetical protein Peur_036993 [Populus x canadensis]
MEQHQTMISILAQERLLGAILGAAFAGFLVFELRKSIYQPISPKNKERCMKPCLSIYLSIYFFFYFSTNRLHLQKTRELLKAKNRRG